MPLPGRILVCLLLCAQPRGGAVAAEPPFKDVTAETGPAFHHFNGMSGALYYPEIFAPGVALFDYDLDGDLDLYVVQGALLGDGKTLEQATIAPKSPLSDRLYRNELIGNGKLRFTDVTKTSGIDSGGYGMGVAVGDYDDDGKPDVYVTQLGKNRLFRNLGEGKFADVTSEAGVGDEAWSSSATFVDYDADGDLDLFVTNYVSFPFGAHRPCANSLGAPEYCGPASYRSLPDRLYRNRGDGTFEDVSAVSHIARVRGAGLGVVAADFNEDGRPDFYVANDGEANRLWLNRGDGTFADEALISGCALNEEGRAEAGMGIVAADLNGDGRGDLFVTHLTGETNTYYAARADGAFDDRSSAAGLALPSRPYTGFGTVGLDYDNDGWIDISVVNGAVKALEEQVAAGSPFPLAQRDQLFRNVRGRFTEVDAGEAFSDPYVGRGLAAGDLDNDGDTDLVVANNSGPLRVLANRTGNTNGWIGLNAVDARGNAVSGARIEVALDDGRALVRRAARDGSYLSSSDPRVLVGTGSAAIQRIVVRWPDGLVEDFGKLERGRYHDLRRGLGKQE